MHYILFFQDDYRVCLANGIIQKGGKLPCPVDASGVFTDEVSDFQGQHVKVTEWIYLALEVKVSAGTDSSTLWPWILAIEKNLYGVCLGSYELYYHAFSYFLLTFNLPLSIKKVKSNLFCKLLLSAFSAKLTCVPFINVLELQKTVLLVVLMPVIWDPANCYKGINAFHSEYHSTCLTTVWIHHKENTRYLKLSPSEFWPCHTQ